MLYLDQIHLSNPFIPLRTLSSCLFPQLPAFLFIIYLFISIFNLLNGISTAYILLGVNL